MNSITEVSCPQCKAIVLWNDDFPNRPFCSKRCQLIDLGAWADESHVISTEITGFEELTDSFDE